MFGVLFKKDAAEHFLMCGLGRSPGVVVTPNACHVGALVSRFNKMFLICPLLVLMIP